MPNLTEAHAALTALAAFGITADEMNVESDGTFEVEFSILGEWAVIQKEANGISVFHSCIDSDIYANGDNVVLVLKAFVDEVNYHSG
tara:strand:- start:2102 stop:2362 length:261 start_codon:yes stop_codon:yes gene_type:complete